MLLACSNLNAENKLIEPGDTILVYLSDNAETNKLYCDLLKMKFPEYNVRLINDMNEFNRFVPAEKYNKRTATFGRHEIGLGMNISDISKRMEEDRFPSLEELLNKVTLNYFFFDIKCETYTESNRMYSDNGSSSTVTLERSRYTLELVKYDGLRLTSEPLEELNIRRDHYKMEHIPLGNIDKASDWLNPLTLTLYLNQYINSSSLNTDESKIDPCKIDEDDTVFICSILNKENVQQEVGLNLRERRFRSKVKFYEHRHIKLKNDAFAIAALRYLNSNQSFYFYYYPDGGRYFYILDAKDLSVVYFRELHKLKNTGQHRGDVKKSSKFRKKCKG